MKFYPSWKFLKWKKCVTSQHVMELYWAHESHMMSPSLQELPCPRFVVLQHAISKTSDKFSINNEVSSRFRVFFLSLWLFLWPSSRCKWRSSVRSARTNPHFCNRYINIQPHICVVFFDISECYISRCWFQNFLTSLVNL